MPGTGLDRFRNNKQIPMTKILILSSHPSPLRGEGKDEGRFAYLDMGVGIYLRFGI